MTSPWCPSNSFLCISRVNQYKQGQSSVIQHRVYLLSPTCALSASRGPGSSTNIYTGGFSRSTELKGHMRGGKSNVTDSGSANRRTGAMTGVGWGGVGQLPGLVTPPRHVCFGRCPSACCFQGHWCFPRQTHPPAPN